MLHIPGRKNKNHFKIRKTEKNYVNQNTLLKLESTRLSGPNEQGGVYLH